MKKQRNTKLHHASKSKLKHLCVIFGILIDPEDNKRTLIRKILKTKEVLSK